MSETWYPIVDLEKCMGCKICVNFCKHGVYTEENGKPVVVKPVGCVHGCRGCQNKCPAGAMNMLAAGNVAVMIQIVIVVRLKKGGIPQCH